MRIKFDFSSGFDLKNIEKMWELAGFEEDLRWKTWQRIQSLCLYFLRLQWVWELNCTIFFIVFDKEYRTMI